MTASVIFVSAQNVDRQIEAIRKAYTEANAKIAAAEADPTSADLYMNELRVNSGRAAWPAVGIYNSTVRFFYEIRGEGPYPNSLFKINVRTERSARIETEELLFDAGEKLVFYFSDDGELRTRAYFADGRAIRFLKGTTNSALTSQAAKSELSS
ncbi:hypothetical protein [Leptolyngbya sp. 7M]|uniref:hypothetical protein n=1 Tax=Leptolyngbya sp. 7M TaxID=2812896 RepID=UPI001B8C9CF7|nr:hypothetical protein [Leptolyngbya sp. 7M]QYO64528.1 hypothetical protein JVX88_33505 [Leptolyngbya sp. 7M]